MASYRVGPGDLFLPADLHADADTLSAQVNALDTVYETGIGLPPMDLVDAWAGFTARWRAFHAATFGGWVTDLAAALNNSNRDQLIQFEQQFENLRGRLASAGVVAAGAEQVTPKITPVGVLSQLTWVLALVAVIVVALLIRKVAA